MTKSKKVLQLQLRYNVNESDLAEQLVIGLKDEGYEVTTLFLRGKPDQGMPVSKAQQSCYFDCKPADLKGFRRWLVILKLYRFCRAHGFAAVIAHRFKPISMMMWIALLLRKPVFIGIEHGIGDYDRVFRRLEAGLLISRRWRIVGVSTAVTRYLQTRVSAFNQTNTLAINNAIDIERASSVMLPAEQARKALGLEEGKRVIGCIGRLVPVKGHAGLITAFAQIAERYPDTLLAIIGEGRSRAELEALVGNHGLQDRVVLLGARDDALQYVKAFDIFAMPSLSEGLPLALLEALAGARAVIGSDIPSLTPILQGCGGAAFKLGDTDELANELATLLDLSDQQLADKGQSGFEYLTNNHAIKDFRAAYQRLLAEMLASDSECS